MKSHNAADWLKRARSNLIMAKQGKIEDGVIYEDLCFDSQQCVEKALKAFLTFRKKIFPKGRVINNLAFLNSSSRHL